MLNSTLNNRGYTLVEVMIALFITMVAVMGIFALVSPAWRTTSLSDMMGRAANVLHDRLQREELWIMNANNDVVTGPPVNETVYARGDSAAHPSSGDMAFNISTTTTQIATNTWQVNVRVTWPGNDVGISESLLVNRQDDYLYTTPLAP